MGRVVGTGLTREVAGEGGRGDLTRGEGGDSEREKRGEDLPNRVSPGEDLPNRVSPGEGLCRGGEEGGEGDRLNL